MEGGACYIPARLSKVELPSILAHAWKLAPRRGRPDRPGPKEPGRTRTCAAPSRACHGRQRKRNPLNQPARTVTTLLSVLVLLGLLGACARPQQTKQDQDGQKGGDRACWLVQRVPLPLPPMTCPRRCGARPGPSWFLGAGTIRTPAPGCKLPCMSQDRWQLHL